MIVSFYAIKPYTLSCYTAGIIRTPRLQVPKSDEPTTLLLLHLLLQLITSPVPSHDCDDQEQGLTASNQCSETQMPF